VDVSWKIGAYLRGGSLGSGSLGGRGSGLAAAKEVEPTAGLGGGGLQDSRVDVDMRHPQEFFVEQLCPLVAAS
jgi:hypothetical protein